MVIVQLKTIPISMQHGADISLLERFEMLQDWKHDCHLLEWKGNRYDEAAIQAFFTAEFERLKPDEIWVNFYEPLALKAALTWSNEITKLWLTDAENFPLWRMEIDPVGKQFVHIYKQIETIYVASEFMKKHAQYHFPQAVVEIRRNPVREKVGGREDGKILFVNCVAEKGYSFAKRLAERMPDQLFLFVQNWRRELPVQPGQYGNVEYRLHAPIEDHFKDTSILIMPSVWKEAFGRLAVEAQSAGIPVIVSDQGGLPEIEEGLPLNYDVWQDRISDIQKNWRYYVEYSFEKYQEYQEKVLESWRDYHVIKNKRCVGD